MKSASFKKIATTYRGAASSNAVAMSIVKKNPGLAAAISKAETTRSGTGYGDRPGENNDHGIQPQLMRTALTKKANAIIDAKSVFRLLPDQEMGAQILTAVITSPRDMVNVEPIYETTRQVLDQGVSSTCLSLVKEFVDETYGLKRKLPMIIRKSLISEGAYVEAAIPESAVDLFINGPATEDGSPSGKITRLGKSLGILGDYIGSDSNTSKNTKAIFESFYNPPVSEKPSYANENLHYMDEAPVKGSPWVTPIREEYVTVTDNPAILKLPEYIKEQMDSRIRSTYEGHDQQLGNVFVGQSDDKIASNIYGTARSHKAAHIGRIPGSDEIKRKTVGEGLIIQLPVESVWTVYTPGDKSEHLGVYVLLDSEGRPISIDDAEKSVALANTMDGVGAGSSLIRRVDMNLSATGGASGYNSNNAEHQQLAMRLFADAVDRDLIKRVQKGTGLDSVALSRNDSLYMLMLNRVLSKRYTQILYIPIQYVTYIAFDYGQNGIGKSLMENGAQINMFRVCLMFSDVVGAMKNSIGRTKMTINVPENDPNPLQTGEMILDQSIRSRAINFTGSVADPADMMAMVQRAGIEVEMTGNKRLPELKVEYEQKTTGYQKADTDLTEHLVKLSAMNLSLQPEIIDAGQNSPEFATSAVANSLLLTKRVMNYHDIFCPQMSEHIKKLVRASGPLREKIITAISADPNKINKELIKTDDLKLAPESEKIYRVTLAFEMFVDSLKMTLPSPVVANIETQATELQTQADALDKALDTVFSEDLFSKEMVGNFSGGVKGLRAHLKASLMRDYLTSKGLFPEVVSMFTAPDKDKTKSTIFDDVISFISDFQKYGIESLARLQPMIRASDADIKKNKIQVGDDSGGDDYGGDSGDDATPDESGGSDPFSSGGEETPPPEDEEENKETENPY